MFKKQYYNTSQISLLIKFIFIPIFLLVVLVAVLCVWDKTRCFLIYYSTYGYEAPDYCGEFKQIDNLNYLLSFEFFLNFLENLIFMTIIYSVLKYPITKDRFKTRTEIFTLFVIWAGYHNLFHGFQLYCHDASMFVLNLINAFQDFSINILYLYLIYVRKKIDSNIFLSILRDFDKFMNNVLCFTFFKEYIKNNHEDWTSFLSFWVDFQIFKKRMLSCNTPVLDESSLDYQNEVTDIATRIYFDYFNPQTNSLNSDGEEFNNSGLFIDLPVDIQEAIEDIASRDFQVDFQLICEMYNDAFSFVNNKLHNIYLSLSQNHKEYQKIEKMLSFTDIDEVNTGQMILGRKTSVEEGKTEYLI